MKSPINQANLHRVVAQFFGMQNQHSRGDMTEIMRMQLVFQLNGDGPKVLKEKDLENRNVGSFCLG